MSEFRNPFAREGVRRAFALAVRRRDVIQRDADDELESVLEGRIERLVAAGMPRDDARAEAIRRMGASVDASRSGIRRSAARRERTMSIREWLDGLGADVRYGLRGLRREPLLSAFVVLTLALGIGANAAMFGIADKLVVRSPAHLAEPGRLARLFFVLRGPAGDERTSAAIDPRVYLNLEEARVFAGLAMFTAASKGAVLGQGESARLVPVAAATANFLSTLGAKPELGRFFTIDEQHSQPSPSIVVLGHALWRGDFGGDPSIVGKTITINGRPTTVIGVAPEGFTGIDLERVDVWQPLTTRVGAAARHWDRGTSSGPALVARLAPGMTLDRATKLATDAYQRTYDGPNKDYATARLFAGPLRFGRGGAEPTEARISRWLLAMSTIVLLVACANIVNLLLARSVRRRREIAVRLAMGAGRARLLRLLLVSSTLLTLIGATVGLLVAAAAGLLVRRVLLPEVDWTSGPVDERVLAYSLVAAVVTGIVIAMLPVLYATRVDVAASLNAGVREGGGRRSGVRSSLMIAQVALAMVLLVGAGLFLRSLERVRSAELGVQPDRVVSLSPRWPRLPADISPAEREAETARRNSFARAVVDQLRALPGVEHAAATTGMPFGTAMSIGLSLPGRDSLPHLAGGFSDPEIRAVSADYFATMGTRLVRGRLFAPQEGTAGERTAVVSETMARVLWPGRDPLGECLLVGTKRASCTRVIGVVQDTRRSKIREEPVMNYYVPLGQEPSLSDDAELVARPRGDAAPAIPMLRSALRRIDPSIRFVDAFVLQDRVEPQTRSWRVGAMMFTMFAGLAVVVAGVGTFSIVAYVVEQRRHEIGVRMALGAEAGQVMRMLLRGAVLLTGAGVLIGGMVGLAAGRVAESLLFETSAHDPAAIGGVALLLILVSAVASTSAAWKAREIGPMAALRDE